MIAALLRNGTPVKVEDADCECAVVTSLGRENIDQRYVGGQGYTPSKTTYVESGELQDVTTLEPDDCDALQNWMDAMADVDRLADDRAPETTAALMIEDAARQQFVEFLHEHSLSRPGTEREITRIFPQFSPELLPPADLFVEERNAQRLQAS